MAKRVQQPTVTLADCMAQGCYTVVARDSAGREVVIGELAPRTFSTGSWGFGLNGKPSLIVNGKPLTLTMSMNATVPGSKDWAEQNPGASSPASTPAVIVPNGPAALYDKTTKQGTLFPSSDMARSIKAVCPNGFYSRCEVITESSPEWGVAKQTCSIEVAKGVAML